MSADRRQFLKLSGALFAAPAVASCGGSKVPDDNAPRSSFDEDSTAEEVTEGIDLGGRIAVVTGCTSGIGYETMRVLAKRGAYVLGTSRSLSRAEEATAGVRGVTSPLALDLGDPQSVIDCAEQLRSLRQPIDILVLNAGYRGGGNERELIGGVEKHFTINHLGHFLLVNRLLDRLYFGWQARVVVVASRTSYTDAPERGILFDDLGMAGKYSDALAYGHSKLANVLFAEALARRLRGTRITANSLHPGVINTDIDRNLNPVLRFGFGILTALVGKSVEQGAATSCFVATNPMLDTTSGAYFEDCNAVKIEDSHHGDTAMADRLWDVSGTLLADYLVTHGEPDASELKNWRPRRPPGGGA